MTNEQFDALSDWINARATYAQAPNPAARELCAISRKRAHVLLVNPAPPKVEWDREKIREQVANRLLAAMQDGATVLSITRQMPIRPDVSGYAVDIIMDLIDEARRA